MKPPFENTGSHPGISAKVIRKRHSTHVHMVEAPRRLKLANTKWLQFVISRLVHTKKYSHSVFHLFKALFTLFVILTGQSGIR
ncbi:hypothetical protein FKM82_019965 [Ascaphus truei]